MTTKPGRTLCAFVLAIGSSAHLAFHAVHGGGGDGGDDGDDDGDDDIVSTQG